jgi:LacI family transcriptional regulator, galactose operon repressor
MPTIRDVAKRLNVSITTVSRALDGYSDVAEETRQLVIKTAQEMGYVPNRAARQLRRQRSETIGYILPAQAPQFADPFFSEFIAGLGDEATSHNFDLLVSTAAPNSEAERQSYERWAHGRKVDGLVLNRMRLHDWRVQYLAQTDLPFVSLERSLDKSGHASVEVDSLAGFTMLMAYLSGKGHKRIAYIGGPKDLKIQADRFEGYKKGLAAAGIPFDPNLVMEGDTTRGGGYRAAQQLFALKPLPTAITCINDPTAIGVLHAASERGLVVGRDLAVAGFDGIADAEHTSPPLTTLKHPLYEIARTLVKMLVAMIQGQPLEERRGQLQPELLIRESTGG